MKSKILLAGVAFAAATAYAEPSVIKTGVTIYDPSKAYSSYVLFTGADDQTHLIDMDGNEVHRWKERGFPSLYIDPALAGGQKGHILLQTSQFKGGAGTEKIPGAVAIFNDRTVGEVDWNDKIVWDFGTNQPGGVARQHHDIRRLPNGNTLILFNRIVHLPGFKAPNQLDDSIEEVTPQGKIVWTWYAGDHLDEFGFAPENLALMKSTPNADYLHFNDMAPLGPNKWYDSGDKRFAPDNIVLDSRNGNFIIIVDRQTGHVVWRVGPISPPLVNSFAWAKHLVPRPVDQTSGQHDAHLIEAGLPGAGNIIVFDNEGSAGYPAITLSATVGSRVIEIDPIKKQIVWEYSAATSHQPPWGFFSSFISSARRLPNGNTLIDEGMDGRFFQVTPAGEIVWEYVSPYAGTYTTPDSRSNWVYRAQPVPYAWAPDGTPHAEQAVQ